MSKQLSEQEIQRRFSRWRYLERLKAKFGAKLKAKDEQIKALKEENKAKDERIAALEVKVQHQAILIDDLQRAVFGKRKRDSIIPEAKLKPKTPPKTREKSSYRRPKPLESEVTNKEHLALETTCSCGGDLQKTGEVTRWLEDIPLPGLTPDYQPRLVAKYQIERGVCLECNKAVVAKDWDLSGQPVKLGLNLKLLICSLDAKSHLSYKQIIDLLAILYGVKVSSGEIANILRQMAKKWQPAYQDLLNEARGSPVVLVDESRWPIRDKNGRGYAWVLSTLNGLVYLAFKDGRGVVHVKELLKGFKGLRVTDGYAAYVNKELKGPHQLCWAHIYRTAKDLRYNQNLPPQQVNYVTWWYEGLADLYTKLQVALDKPTNLVSRVKQKTKLETQLNQLLNSRPGPNGEPVKLTKLKNQLRKAASSNKLFVCLIIGGVCDNNQAERDLRQLVIKRKISFGSVSEAGARALATVMTICINTWRKHPNNYFKALATLN